MKCIHPLRKAGWQMVKIPSHMVDSIWQKDNMLHVRFATGQSFTFGELSEEKNEKDSI